MKRSHLLLCATCAVVFGFKQNQNRNTGAQEMYISKVAKVFFILSAIAWPLSSPATTFNYNVDVELALSQFNTGNWWLQGYSLPSPTQVDIGDTVVINVNFTNGLVQFDNTGSVLEFSSFSLNSPAGTSKSVSSQYYREFDFLDTSGDLLASHFEGPSSSGSSVGSVQSTTLNLNQNNLTDSGFSFGGLSFLFTINAGSTGYPNTFTNFDVRVIGGNVSLAPVPTPAAAWLFGSGLLGLIGISRRKKAS